MQVALSFKNAADLCVTADAVLDCLLPNVPVRKDVPARKDSRNPTVNYVMDLQPNELKSLRDEVTLVNENLRQHDPEVKGDTFEVVAPRFA